MSICEEPARKLFLSQCFKITPHYADNSKKYHYWTLPVLNKVFPVGLVWIQGVITNVTKVQNTTLQVEDGTGTAIVLAAEETPGFGTWVSKGQYAMIVGELIAVRPTIKIKAIKLTEISDKNAEAIWILEVLDIWKHLQSNW